MENIVPLPYTKSHNNSIKDQWPELSPGRQKGKAKQRPKDAQPTGTIKRERGNLSGGAYTQSARGVPLMDDFSLEANHLFLTLRITLISHVQPLLIKLYMTVSGHKAALSN